MVLIRCATGTSKKPEPKSSSATSRVRSPVRPAPDLHAVHWGAATLSPRPTGGETSTGLGLVIVKKLVELQGSIETILSPNSKTILTPNGHGEIDDVYWYLTNAAGRMQLDEGCRGAGLEEAEK